MSVTRWAAATDAIVTTLGAAPALAGVKVVDGPPTGEETGANTIWVGWSGDPDDPTSGGIQQTYHDTGAAAKRDETAEVNLTLQSASGNDDMSAVRSSAVTLLGAVETVLRGNPSLGLADVLRIELSDGTFRQFRDSEGVGCQITFTLTITSLI